jgi:hypothetical protein
MEMRDCLYACRYSLLAMAHTRIPKDTQLTNNILHRHQSTPLALAINIRRARQIPAHARGSMDRDSAFFSRHQITNRHTGLDSEASETCKVLGYHSAINSRLSYNLDPSPSSRACGTKISSSTSVLPRFSQNNHNKKHTSSSSSSDLPESTRPSLILPSVANLPTSTRGLKVQRGSRVPLISFP